MEKLLNPDKVHTWLSSLWPKSKYPQIIAGINDDDCAILSIGDKQTVITTDFLNANPIAKQLGFASYKDLGKLLVAANISDLLGTGAKPIAFLASIMMNKGAELKEFEEIIEGIEYQLGLYNVPLVGGDTKLGRFDVLSGTAIGVCQDEAKLFPKNKAKVGDKIWLSGEIGNVGAAVSGINSSEMTSEWNEWAKDILINPVLPFYKSNIISLNRAGNGGTDISDGLGENLYDLCESSGVGARLYASKIHMNSHVVMLADKLLIPSWYFAFSIGGDFQFIVTAEISKTELLSGLGLIEIGEITEERKIEIEYKDEIYTLPRLGHTDFNIKSFANEVEGMLNSLKINLLK